MGTWKTNTGELKQGMTVRLPGSRKELNVISVKGGEAKLDNGERISARSEVEILTIPPPESRPSSPAERLKAQAAARRGDERDEDEDEDELDSDPDDDENDGWNVNDSDIGLEKGMLICRFGKDEELPVVRIKGGRAVVKLQSGALADVDCHDRKITWKWPDDVVSKMREREQEKEREKENDRRKAAVSSRDLREQDRDEEDEEEEVRQRERDQDPEHYEEEYDERTAAEEEDEKEDHQSKIQPQTTSKASGETWYKLEELSSLVGHHWSKINKIRKAGELPKGSYKEDGRSILYNEDAREYLAGVEKDRRGRRHAEKEEAALSPREKKGDADDENNGETVRQEQRSSSREIPSRSQSSHPEPLRRPTNIVPAGGVLGVLDIAIERASNEIEEALDRVKKLKALIETLKEQRRQF